ELSQHGELVPTHVVFCPKAVLEAADDDRRNFNRLAGGGNAHELARLSSATDAPPHYLIVVGNNILNGEVKVRKAGSERANKLQQAGASCAENGGELRPCVIGCKNGCLARQVATVPGLFDPSAYDCFVFFC